MDVEVHLPNGRAPSILLDGKPVEHITQRLRIDADAGGRTLTLHLALGEVRVKGKAVVTVSEETAKALVVLGWKPPQADSEKEV
ncbi:hypothetical protein AB0C27_40500 [Nonomuraea sp. NPDC048882]|uniref:hypothetical protein n=1 Tax=Nonomuraea sp. NPDC048882 TaxID=3154347 RepID=UPI0033F11366